VLFALSNPYVTCGSTFVDDFCGHMGCLLCLIHALPVEAVSFMISDSAATQFLLMISKPHGLFALSNPCLTHVSSFVDDF